MKIVGLLLLVGAALVAVIAFFAPVNVNRGLDGTFDCGPAAFNITQQHRTGDDPNDVAIVDHNCTAGAWQHFIVGGAITAVLVAAGAIILAIGGATNRPHTPIVPAAPGWYPSLEGDEERWWDGRMWTPHRRRR